jgi:hypothetical protein
LDNPEIVIFSGGPAFKAAFLICVDWDESEFCAIACCIFITVVFSKQPAINNNDTKITDNTKAVMIDVI